LWHQRRLDEGMQMSGNPQVESFFDQSSNTISYLVWDNATLRGAIVDPVLDFDPPRAAAATRSVDRIVDRARELGVTVDLCVPAMFLAALQVNIRAGRVPDVLRVPVTWTSPG
jgi:hypothetical protein